MSSAAEHPYHAHVRQCESCSGPYGHCSEGLQLLRGRDAPNNRDKSVSQKVFHSGALQIAMQAGSWFDRKDLPLPEREMKVAELISDFAVTTANSDTALREQHERGLDMLRRVSAHIAKTDARSLELIKSEIDVFLISQPSGVVNSDDGPRCTCRHQCPSREEWMDGAQCIHAPDCELMLGKRGKNSRSQT